MTKMSIDELIREILSLKMKFEEVQNEIEKLRNEDCLMYLKLDLRGKVSWLDGYMTALELAEERENKEEEK